MALAIFDLDNTLLGGDSDYLWGQFLIEQGLVDGAHYERENQRFYDEYRAGTLDIHAFLAFMLQPLAEHPLAELLAWRARFLEEKIQPILLPKADELLNRHRVAGDTLLIITATNRFITAPIAERLGVSHLLASEPEYVDGRYTGRSTGVPCFQHGKVERLNAWLTETGGNLARSWFYSDSHNDLPLLGRVTYPVAVDPDATLANHAKERGWPIISLRG
ncbi:MAG TPA: HAD family hydrolase [Candidatus Competibacteraceae bacterium]|nr:HAD family hydrolase [Candidatus Competibacteraceae bacterium]MCP5132944.1 HAD family hydrolase [Gammaproteobacteria bacterium]HPF58258.1 HAD family hydrolase [Candidatus Competibacteraceae bacterium]HRX71304.1 HAD family hydrolase [Candidatus Competibacteraceae bacterium]